MIQKFCVKFINVLFILITGLLFTLSTVRHAETDINTYEQFKHITPHQIIVYLGLALVFTSILVFIYITLKNDSIKTLIKKFSLKKNDSENKRFDIYSVVVIIATAITALTSVFWIFFNDTVPHSDQAIILDEARKMAGYLDEPYNHSYMASFNFMRLLVMFMSVLLRIFGDSQMVFRVYNIFAIIALVTGMSLTVRCFMKDRAASAVISIVLIFFYPIVVYTSYVYGTISAVAFEIWAFYLMMRCVEEIDRSITKRNYLGYGIGAVLCFTLGVQMHMSALIGMVAAIIYIVLKISKKNLIKNISLIIAIAGFYFVSSIAINRGYEAVTGSPRLDAIPISAKIYMGITSPETQPNGPGSQDGSYWAMFELNDCDAKKTNEYLWPIIKDIAFEYLRGERDMLYFLKKVEFQWLDSSVDAHRIILLNNPNEGEPANRASFVSFYDGKLRRIIYKLGIVFMIMLYGLSLVAGIKCLLRKDNSLVDVHFLIQIFVIGGFTFQLIAESITRYVFSYYVLLIIEAVYGVTVVCDCILLTINKLKNKYNRQNVC